MLSGRLERAILDQLIVSQDQTREDLWAKLCPQPSLAMFNAALQSLCDKGYAESASVRSRNGGGFTTLVRITSSGVLARRLR